MAAVSSKEATAYLIDPLTAPEPSAETGPGSHFVPPPEPASRPRSSSTTNNPYRHSSKLSTSSAHSRHSSRGTSEKFPNYRENALGQLNDSPPNYDAATSPSTSTHRRRGSSLKERYPGDESHKPLEILRRDSKKAHRSPHLTKRHLPGADSIDRLDPTISAVPYHHEGPYDAAGLARNHGGKKKGLAPIDALETSNREALKATPVENVKNSVERHVPLDGTAVVPPGMEDRFGRRYDYQEGGNLMVEGDPEGGAYKRWPGVNYHPDDIKGKGEPSYSQDLALRAKAGYGEEGGAKSIEMEDHKGVKVEGTETSGRARGASFTQGLKKRIGSLKKKHRDE